MSMYFQNLCFCPYSCIKIGNKCKTLYFGEREGPPRQDKPTVQT